MLRSLPKETIESIYSTGRVFSDTVILLHEAIARKAGLSGTDHKYLGFLVRNGPLTAGEFSTLTGLTTGAITGLTDRLEKRKLAKRMFHKTDRRKIIIVPNTKNATKLLGTGLTELKQEMTNLFSTLSDKETEIIEKYLLSTIGIMNGITSRLNKNKQ